MAAIDLPAAETDLGGIELVEVHPRGILVEPGRQHVLRLFDGDAIHMVDPLAGAIVVPEMGRTGEPAVIVRQD